MLSTKPRLWLPIAALALACAVTAALPGCGGQGARSGGPIQLDPQTRATNAMHPALHGTVGEYAVLLDSVPVPVEGYGLVVGLPNTGSGSMDPKVRQLLINRLLVSGAASYQELTRSISPERILESDQVAAVEIRGIIPPLARKGQSFDIYVNAFPNSGAKSLANGLLWTADLKVRGLYTDGTDSATIALGRGPVFIPAALETAASPKPEVELPRALRTGRIIAGGVCANDQPARLQLHIPSYRITAAIERAINAHFPARNAIDRIATAENDSVITLRIPRDYVDTPMNFVDICRHLYLTTEQPGFNETKARELVEAMKQPDAPHRSLSLALQGLGTSILPDYIQRNYMSSEPALRFWTARAGANMFDVKGITLLQETIKDQSSKFRRQALLALIEASRGRDTERATLALMDMLRSSNTDDRILAYHGLLALRSRAITSYTVSRKFVIDILPADSPPMIYVLQADSPRIAFIGRPITLPEGALYISRDKLLTVAVELPDEAPAGGDGVNPVLNAMALNAAPLPISVKPKDNVKLYWRPPLTQGDLNFRIIDGTPRITDQSVTLLTNQNLPSLVYRASWIPDALAKDFDERSVDPYIGATYQRVAEMLAEMCANKTIDAKFVAQFAPDAVVSPTDLILGGRAEGGPAESAVEIKPPTPLQPLDGGQPIMPDGK